MKNRFYLFLFMLLGINSSLFAFSNSYFSVSDKGWTVHKKSDKVISFVLKDYTPDEEDVTGITPTININIEEDPEKHYVAKFDNKELKTFSDTLKTHAYKDYLEEAKRGSRQYLEQAYKNAPRKQIDEIIDKLYEESGITSESIGKVGDSKAYKIDFNISKMKFRRFLVVSLNRLTIIEFSFPDTVDIESLKEYKDFVSSFKNNDSAPTQLNAYIYGSVGKNLLRLLFVTALAAGVGIYKKMKGVA